MAPALLSLLLRGISCQAHFSPCGAEILIIWENIQKKEGNLKTAEKGNTGPIRLLEFYLVHNFWDLQLKWNLV